jgi:hypothetical protein
VSNDCIIVLVNTTTPGTVDISGKAYADTGDAANKTLLDGFVTALQTAVAGSTDITSLKAAVAAWTSTSKQPA